MLELSVVLMLLVGITPTIVVAVWLTHKFLAMCRKWGEDANRAEALRTLPRKRCRNLSQEIGAAYSCLGVKPPPPYTDGREKR